jgi:EmrB/QacA subfamily drug resistance transporter
MSADTQRTLTVAALLLSMFLAAMEATVVATAMPTVVSELGGLEVYGWVGAAYLLASTSTMPLFGKLADRIGRKPVLLFGLLLFMTGSLACGIATSIGQLIVFRALQGLGAGAVQPTVLTVVGDLYPPAERGRIQAFFSAIWGFAGVSGPLLGGAIVASTSWRWVFLLNLPFGLAAAAVLAFAYRENARTKPQTPLDVAGAVTLLLGATSLLLAASSVMPALTGVLGVGLAGLFLFLENRAPDPVLPLQLVGRRLVAVASAASVLQGAAMTGTLTYLPLHVQGVLLGHPTAAGLVITPMLVAWPIAASLTTRFLGRVGYRAPVLLGTLVLSLGLLLVAGLAVARVPGVWLGVGSFLFGFGMGLASTAILIGVQSSVGWEQRGVATAVILFARTMGGALGVGALGAVLASRLRDTLEPRVVQGLLDPHGRDAVLSIPGVVDALGAALQPLFWATAACAVLSLLVVAAYPRDSRPV